MPRLASARQVETSLYTSAQVESLFNPIRGVRDLERRKGKTPTDHAKINRQAISEQSKRNAMQKLVRCLALGKHCTEPAHFLSYKALTLSHSVLMTGSE
jgi:hypothetical protein